MRADQISRFPVPDINSLPDDLRDRLLKVQEKSGFIPNVFLGFIHRPEEFRAFFNYHDALMLKDSGLSKGEREMIVVATSGINECIYCVVAHGAILRVREKNTSISEQLATNYKKAEITPRQRTMLDFAVKVSQDAQNISKKDFEVLEDQGFTQEDIWDIGSIAALFALSNRIANMSGIMPNDEFYAMGRTLKNETD